MSEQWRPVVGYDGIYEVSDQGQLRSQRRSGSAGGLFTPVISSKGYYTVSLRREGRQRTLHLHKLVAEAFLGPLPDGQHTRHLDGDQLNNAVSNLSYGTPSENTWDQVEHGTHANKRKTHCPREHSYDDPANVIIYRNMRYCRTCQDARNAGRKR